MKACAQGGKDQLVSRCAALLDINDLNFSILPPHFGLEQELPDFAVLLPDYANLPVSFHGVVRILFAQLVYHHQFLIDTFPQDHPLFKSAIYTSGTVAEFVANESLHKPWYVSCNKDKCSMRATGVPPHVVLQFQVEELQNENRKLHGETRRHVSDVMDDLGQKLQELPDAVCVQLEDRFKIDGKELSLASVKELLAQQMNEMKELLRSRGRDRSESESHDDAGGGAGGDAGDGDNGGAGSAGERDISWWQTWTKTLSGQQHFCFTPEDFKWPAYVRPSHCPSYCLRVF